MHIGVVIPVRGFSPYLLQTLESVLDQRLPADDVVVVDDGSWVPQELPVDVSTRVSVVQVGPTGRIDAAPIVRAGRSRSAPPASAGWGPAVARNAGVATLRPDVELVAFCDPGDVWGPGHLVAMARAAERVPGADVLAGDAVVVGPDDRPTTDRWIGLGYGQHHGFLVRSLIYEQDRLCVSSTVVRRAAFDAVGGFDERLAQEEDLDLWLRLIDDGTDLVSVLGATVRLRRHAGSRADDLVARAQARILVHERHEKSVEPVVARRSRSADLWMLGAGRARAGDFAAAREAWDQAGALLRPLPSERLRRALLSVPLVRGRLRVTA